MYVTPIFTVKLRRPKHENIEKTLENTVEILISSATVDS